MCEVFCHMIAHDTEKIKNTHRVVHVVQHICRGARDLRRGVAKVAARAHKRTQHSEIVAVRRDLRGAPRKRDRRRIACNVRINAVVDKDSDNLNVAILGRAQQRARAAGDGVVRVGTHGQKVEQRRGVTVLRGKVQGRRFRRPENECICALKLK